MKITLTNQILYVVLGICLLAAMLFCVQTISISGDLRNYNGKVTAINSWRASVQQLAVDCVEYSKRNQAITPILQQAGLLGGTNTASAQKSGGK